MEHNVCIIYTKYIKYRKLKAYKKIYLSLFIILLNIPSISLSTNESNNILNQTNTYRNLKDPTMPKTFNIQYNQNKLYNHNNVDDDDETLLKLNMIMIKDSIKTATINNQILKEQDQIEGYKIVSITEDKVILQDLISNRDEKFYNKFKNFFSKNKISQNNQQEKFIKLYLSNITIKIPVEDKWIK